MLHHRDVLEALIEAYLAGRMSFDDFGPAFSHYFIEKVPEDALTTDDLMWYHDVHERIEWTTDAPTPEDVGYGYTTPSQYFRWLQRHCAERPAAG